MEIGYLSDIGKRRDLDEDSVAILKVDSVFQSKVSQRYLFILADGMGGHNAGEVASHLGVKSVAEKLISILLDTSKSKDKDDQDYSSVLKLSIKEANKAILDYVKKNPSCEGMGTTLTCAILIDQKLLIGHVGDSRVYLINKNEIVQITKDHSYVQELVDKGGITPEEAKSHRQKNVITRVVGVYDDVDADIFERTLWQEDNILLCCDGVTDIIDDQEIKKIVLKNNNPQESCDELVKLANDRGGPDNISVILFKPTHLPSREKILSAKTEAIAYPSEMKDKESLDDEKRILNKRLFGKFFLNV